MCNTPALTAAKRIPSTIHQIWVGTPVPPQIEAWMAGWPMLHPEYAYRLWTDRDASGLVNQQLYDAATSPAMKADILRCEILLDHGGIYVDADFECHRPVTPLVDGATLVLLNDDAAFVNGFLAGVPGHPLFASLVDRLPEHVAEMKRQGLSEPNVLTGPYFLTRVVTEMALPFNQNTRVLASDYMLQPRNRNPQLRAWARERRTATHHDLASWQRPTIRHLLRKTKLRTRWRRFMDLSQL